MRVLAISNLFPPHHVGGAELSAFSTCLGLLERGVDASVLMVNARLPQRTDGQYVTGGIPVHKQTFLPSPFKGPFLQIFDPRVFRAVATEIRRMKPDLVHVHNVSGASLAPFVACRQLDVPVVVTLHDHWLLCANNMLYQGNGVSCDPREEPRGCNRCFRRYDFWANIPRRRQVLHYLVRNVRLFVSPSRGLVDRHVAAGYDRSRFRVIPSGIHPAAFTAPADRLIAEYARESSYLHTLFFAGALVESKGIGTIATALPLLSGYVDRLCLLVAGQGEESCVAALRKLDPRAVRLLGRVPYHEMRVLYAGADLTVVPSICYDNSPLVVYESLLAGTPVLGADIGGIPELVQDGETGYLHPAGDAAAFAEQVILHFSRSALQRRRMRRRCLEYAHTCLTMDRHIDALLQVYDKVLVR